MKKLCCATPMFVFVDYVFGQIFKDLVLTSLNHRDHRISSDWLDRTVQQQLVV
jgi:hypothetical protein